MAVKFACDGCGKDLEPDDVTRIGLFKKRDYCAKCADAAEAFIVDRDKEHDKAARAFQNAMKRLHGKHHKAIKTLPDAD